MTAGTRLSTPPKLKRGTCRIVQLGGLEEVGRNMVCLLYTSPSPRD